MREYFEPFLGLPLRRVLYYRIDSDINADLNYPGMHDVSQGVELKFDTGYCFITWDTTAEQEISILLGRMTDFLSAGLFEDMSNHLDWQSRIGQPLEEVQILLGEVVLKFGKEKVFLITASVNAAMLQAEANSNNLTLFFSKERRDKFFAQYQNI